jgi:hypothetical protein
VLFPVAHAAPMDHPALAGPGSLAADSHQSPVPTSGKRTCTSAMVICSGHNAAVGMGDAGRDAWHRAVILEGVSNMGLEVAVGFLIAWVVGKARRAGKQLDGVADQMVDASAVRLRDVLLRKLGGDSSVQRLQLEAAETGEVSDRTRQRVTLALEDAVEQDTQFAAELESALAEAEKNGALVATSGGTVVSGTANATAPGSVAIGAVGRDANLGQAPDPHRPDRT